MSSFELGPFIEGNEHGIVGNGDMNWTRRGQAINREDESTKFGLMKSSEALISAELSVAGGLDHDVSFRSLALGTPRNLRNQRHGPIVPTPVTWSKGRSALMER